MDKEDKKNSEQCGCKDCNCENCNCGNNKIWWHRKHHHFGRGHGGSGFYFFGFVAGLFYFLQHAVTSSDYIWGILKAIVWPALVIFKLFSFLHL